MLVVWREAVTNSGEMALSLPSGFVWRWQGFWQWGFYRPKPHLRPGAWTHDPTGSRSRRSSRRNRPIEEKWRWASTSSMIRDFPATVSARARRATTRAPTARLSSRLVTPSRVRLPFSVPSVFNAALSFRLDWEGDICTLKDQVAVSLDGPGTMAGNVDAALYAVAHKKGMTEQFGTIYGGGLDRSDLLDAIATYERSLLTSGSRFDKCLEGDAGALTADELSGYQLFKSFGCIACPQGVNVGGNLFEKSDIFHALILRQSIVLRVPSLRNVAVTGPYFHDGSVPTLQSAVRKMGQAQLGRTLSDEQVNAIVTFLKTLTGVYQGRKVTAPP
jgi:cytochrome c peroxidase